MDTLAIVGAREGNLRDVTLAIPKNKITVFAGVSGSGTSTLLVDVLATECQRLHLEALSGPDGGNAGGRLMFAGTPAALAAHGEGATAACLRRTLGR